MLRIFGQKRAAKQPSPSVPSEGMTSQTCGTKSSLESMRSNMRSLLRSTPHAPPDSAVTGALLRAARTMAKANTPNHLFDPAIWSDEVMRQAMDVFHFTSKQSSEYIFMKMMEKNKEQVTNAVRDQIHGHLPKSVAGPVGDRIRDSLEEVREFHWKDLEESQETWAYELRFNVEGEKLCIRKQFTLDKIV